MLALIKHPEQPLTLREVAAPMGTVVVKVSVVGICRTDSRVVSGEVPVRFPIIVGHEFSGVIARGPMAGRRVAADPMLDGAFMGLDRDGALAEFACVPYDHLYFLPEHISDEVGAYLEPVSASLAVTRAGITRTMKGAVCGEGRIARLTLLTLETEGYDAEVLHEGREYDYVVETGQSDLAPALAALRQNGLLIVKSRCKAANIPLGVFVQKELRAIGAAYAPYDDALAWLARNSERMADFIGKTYAFEDFHAAFAQAAATESVKTFIRVS